MKRPVEEIEAWEADGPYPSYPQLEKLAYQIYKRPLAVFFLPTPPEEISPAREFRTLPAEDLQSLAADTHLHIRRAHAYQLALRELFGARNPSEHCIWQELSVSRARSVVEQAAAVRNYLGITLEEQIRWKGDEQAL
ncbi:MAG: DNA-binding protein, partial [Pseudomonadota bacterium]